MEEGAETLETIKGQLDLLLEQASILNGNVLIVLCISMMICCLIGTIVGYAIARGS